MEIRNKPIKKLNYYLILGFSIFQFLFIISMCIICIVLKYSNIFVHVTNWSFILSSFYLISLSICDTNLYFFSSKKLERYNYFIRNNFSKIAFPFCFMITIGFWGILLFGIIIQADTFVRSGVEIKAWGILLNLNLHLFITIMMIVELFLNERKEVNFNVYIIIPNTILFLIYGFVTCIAKYAFDHNAYVFMENLNVGGMIIVGIIIYGLLIGCIFIYKVLSNWINRNSFKVIEKGEEENFIENEGINEENFGLSPE